MEAHSPEAADKPGRLERGLAAQSAYFLATGAWPLLHRRSFEAVTGKKSDYWLAQTVGLLVLSIGASVALSLRRGQPAPETRLGAVSASLALAGIDVVHVARRRISPVYLGDAVVELALAATTLRAMAREARQPRRAAFIRSAA